MNWSLLRHIVEDMDDEEPFDDVCIVLPNGEVMQAAELRKDAGKWFIVAKPKE